MLKKFITRVARGQKGFTLIEMIVVVGIIAVLAAVIVPNIGRFIGSGEQGAKDAEAEAVQTAMNAMMADVAITDLDNRVAPNTAVNAWASPFPTGTDVPATGLSGYLQSANTTYYYCWDDNGQLLADANGDVAFETNVACPADPTP